MQTIKPANNQLFCKREEATSKTKSGILIQNKSAEKPQMAEVINVGKSVESFKPKETIVYKPYATVDISLNKEDYFLINEEDVLGTVIEVE